MAYTLIAQGTARSTNSNGFTTASFNSTGGDLIVVADVSLVGAGGVTISDNKSSSFVAVNVGDYIHHFGFVYAKNIAGGTGHTITVAGTGVYPAIAYFVFSGSDLGSPLDQNTTGAAASEQSDTLTPSMNGCLLVSAMATEETAATWTINGGFSTPIQQVQVASQNYGIAASYLVQTSAAVAAPLWARSSGTALIENMMIVFKPSSAPTAVLSGTITASVTEADIVTGGKTIILTITGDTFIP